MKAYLAFFRMQFMKGLQYRTAALAGVVTQFFWGFMETQLYRALYAEHADAFPMTLTATITYTWLRQAFLALLNPWRFENELFEMIRTGSIGYELCRPVSLYGMWFSRTMADRMSKAVLRCIPVLFVSFLLPPGWGIGLPSSIPAFVAFLFSLLLATSVMVSYCLILYFSTFYTVMVDGLKTIIVPVVDLLSGNLIPLPFMPDILAGILKYSPFGAMTNAPLRIYSGDIQGTEVLETIVLQILWLMIMISVGYLMEKRGLRQTTVEGG